jgi:hypothetical protein
VLSEPHREQNLYANPKPDSEVSIRPQIKTAFPLKRSKMIGRAKRSGAAAEPVLGRQILSREFSCFAGNVILSGHCRQTPARTS